MSVVLDREGVVWSVDRLIRHSANANTVTAHFDGHDEPVIFDPETFMDGLQKTFIRTVPAQPGTFVIGAEGEEPEPELWRDPVIAWALNTLGDMCPVCLSGTYGPAWQLAVQMPDGTVQDGATSHANLDEYRRAEGWLKKVLAGRGQGEVEPSAQADNVVPLGRTPVTPQKRPE